MYNRNHLTIEEYEIWQWLNEQPQAERLFIYGRPWHFVGYGVSSIHYDKARQMKEAFRSWIWADIDRRDHYVEKYNYLFNAIRGREYDGSHQTFPGMNPAISLRPHQQNA